MTNDERIRQAIELLEQVNAETGTTFALLEIPAGDVDWHSTVEQIAERLGAFFEVAKAPLKLSIEVVE